MIGSPARTHLRRNRVHLRHARRLCADQKNSRNLATRPTGRPRPSRPSCMTHPPRPDKVPTTRDTPQTSVCVVHRYYTPAAAQFLSVDPAMIASGAPYEFGRDDPINTGDTTGALPHKRKKQSTGKSKATPHAKGEARAAREQARAQQTNPNKRRPKATTPQPKKNSTNRAVPVPAPPATPGVSPSPPTAVASQAATPSGFTGSGWKAITHVVRNPIPVYLLTRLGIRTVQVTPKIAYGGGIILSGGLSWWLFLLLTAD